LRVLLYAVMSAAPLPLISLALPGFRCRSDYQTSGFNRSKKRNPCFHVRPVGP
jgi:hypothetical protein